MARRRTARWALAGIALAACGGRTGLDVSVPQDAADIDGPTSGDDAVADAADAGSIDVIETVDAADAADVTDVADVADVADVVDAVIVADVIAARGCPSTGQVVLASGEPSPTAIAVDAANVYWATTGAGTNSGKIRSMPKAGGAITTIADGQADPRALLVDANYVYWYDGADARVVRRAPIGGGAAFDYPVVVDFTEDARTLAADSRNLYYNSYGTLGIPKAGGAQFTVDSTDFVYRLAADDNGVYWVGPIVGGPSMAVFAYPAGASAPTMLAQQQEVSDAIAIDDGWVYFEGAGLLRVPRNGGAVETLVPGPLGAMDIAVDDLSLYWAEGLPGGGPLSVSKIPKAGGARTQIASGMGWAFQMALDRDCVYWTNGGTDSVEAVAKSPM
jgi:hypothetical protein